MNAVATLTQERVAEDFGHALAPVVPDLPTTEYFDGLPEAALGDGRAWEAIKARGRCATWAASWAVALVGEVSNATIHGEGSWQSAQNAANAYQITAGHVADWVARAARGHAANGNKNSQQ